MSLLIFTLATLLVGLAAGFVGALTGLGGGLIVTPALTLLLGVDIKYAIGASLIATIATSSGSAAAYVRDGLSNVRVGMLLEIATVFGALFGAYLGSILSTSAISIVFGLVMLQTAYQSARGRHENQDELTPDPLAVRLGLDGEYKSPQGLIPYHVQKVKLGFVMM